MPKINNLILELNSACNSRCLYCYLPQHKDTGQGTLEYFKKKLDKYAGQGIQNVDLTGGEPTLYKDLLELVSYAKHLRYPNLTLVSNGKLVSSRRYCAELLRAGITRFVFCLDGTDDEMCDKISGAQDSYTLVDKAIKNIKDLNKSCEVCVTCVVNSLNYKYIPQIVAKAKKSGVDLMNIQHILPYVKDKRVKCRRLPAGIIIPYARSFPYVAKALRKYGPGLRINVHFIPYCYLPGFEKYLEQESCKHDRLVVHYKGFEYNIGKHLQKGCVKIAKCRKCPYTKKCPGFFKSYKKELGIKELL